MSTEEQLVTIIDTTFDYHYSHNFSTQNTISVMPLKSRGFATGKETKGILCELKELRRSTTLRIVNQQNGIPDWSEE